MPMGHWPIPICHIEPVFYMTLGNWLMAHWHMVRPSPNFRQLLDKGISPGGGPINLDRSAPGFGRNF